MLIDDPWCQRYVDRLRLRVPGLSIGAAEEEARLRFEECAGCLSPEKQAEKAVEGWLRNNGVHRERPLLGPPPPYPNRQKKRPNPAWFKFWRAPGAID